MELCNNTLLDWITTDSSQRLERILRIAPADGSVILIDILNQQAMPYDLSAADVQAAVENKEFRVIGNDPYFRTVVESEIPEKHRLRRDRAWELIAPIIKLPDGGLFDETKRFEMISKISVEQKVPPTSLYRHIRRFWKRGQTKNALLPEYGNCGAPGKERLPGEAKRGRPKEPTTHDGVPRGINIGPEEKRFIELAIKWHYGNSKAPNPPSLHASYQFMLERFFRSGLAIKDGVPRAIIPQAHEVPTYGQFLYYWRKRKSTAETIIAREGKRRFNLKYRAIGGDAATRAYGPGAMYQIDSTPANINLVGALNPNGRIGRPVVYFTVDVFSRMIVGFSVSLEEESYVSAMLSLENALTDKVEYCAKYGIRILEEEWPSHHIPEQLVADRGELISKNADLLANTLGIQVTNTPAHRPDLKPYVERMFRTAQDEVLHQLPGSVNQRHERGDRDERLDAVLTLEDFRKILIQFILRYNSSRIEGFRLKGFMLPAQLEPRPCDLWAWGIENRAGHLRTMSSDSVRLNLLPRSEATVTDRGIRFRKMYYTCDTALKEQWQIEARSKRSWKIPVAYHPHHTELVYRVAEREFEVCRMLDANAEFAGRSWQEVEDFYTGMNELKDLSATRELQSKADRNANIATIVKNAIERRQSVEPPESKAAALRNIRENRMAERDRERAGASAPTVIEANTNTVPFEINTTSTTTEGAYVPRPTNFELLRVQRKEHMEAK